MEQLQLEHFISFMEYNTRLFESFLDTKNYEDLQDFVIMCELIEYFRIHLKGYSAIILLEAYVVEIKRFAMSFYDLCERYGYDDDENLINEYTDKILAL